MKVREGLKKRREYEQRRADEGGGGRGGKERGGEERRGEERRGREERSGGGERGEERRGEEERGEERKRGGGGETCHTDAEALSILLPLAPSLPVGVLRSGSRQSRCQGSARRA